MSEEEKTTEELAEKPEETKETQETQEAQAKWDTERQRADQEHANFERVSAEKTALQDEMTQQQTKVAELEAKIEAKVQKENLSLDELDPDLVDRTVIKNITKLQGELANAVEKVSSLEAKAVQYEQIEQQRQAQERKDTLIEKILKPLDKKYGAKYRNEAKKLADELVDSGKKAQPKDALDARDLLDECYRQVTEKAKPEKKKTPVTTDTGAGTISISDKNLKGGSLNDVAADMLENKESWQ